MNSDIIRQLPDSVANQIAAGEVIQRPASVVKELVENSVDAKATKIDIILKDAGRTLIQVSDNGIGMSATDARMSFARHSTSKISCADDLFTLRTMGFRGEALASIAAISQVELRTQRIEDALGTCINLIGNDCKQEPVMYGKGTCFKIKNIFYNVPARRKFLKSNQVELSNILREFERLALINESIEFSINHNEANIHSLNSGTFKHRIVSLFGKMLDKQLVPVNVDTSIVKIEGYISMPEYSRKRNYLQYLFVNGRYMKHPYFHKAILTCFDQLIPHDHQPNYFLKFSVDPQTIDVNIHPTKTEIKFENEQLIWPIITAAIKESIGRYSIATTIDFNKEDAIDIPVITKDTKIINPDDLIKSDYNPFTQRHTNVQNESKVRFNNNTPLRNNSPMNWEMLYDSFISNKGDSGDVDIPDVIEQNADKFLKQNAVDNEIIESSSLSDGVFDYIENSSNNYIQIKGKYIATSVKSGMMLIDQHRAHLLVIYNELLHQQATSGSVASQSVIFPEIIEVSPAQNLILQDLKGELYSVGFNITKIDDNSWKIEGVPSGLNNINYKDIIFELIDSVSENTKKPNIKTDLIFEIARRSAIQYGVTLSEEDMDSLVGKLLAIPSPNYTPNGKIVIKIISIDQLNKIFV
ncbi:MAG: DNA mismatch repair endonuclease MutL [Muribaculaceae bacterium]|nr:DNA mismatch repair endonuclease MutL [Muribaculaceae bacterium]